MRLFAIILLSGCLSLLGLSADTASKYSPLLPVRMGIMYGFVDRTGHLSVYPQYLDAFAFNQGLAYVKKGKFYGMINEEGKVIIPFHISKIETHVNEGYVALHLYPAGYRFYGVKGDSLPGTYPWAGSFTEGVAPVQFAGDSMQYFVDKTGKKAIMRAFEKTYGFSQELAAIRIQKKWGFIDHKGNMVIDTQFDEVKNFSEGFAAVLKNGKVGYIDKKGKWLIEPTFQNAGIFKEGIALVLLDKKIGFVTTDGKYMLQPKYDMGFDFSEGLAFVGSVRDSSHFGFIDKTGNLAIPLRFNRVLSFSEGLAAANFKGKWGYIDKTGKFVIPPKYESAESFDGGGIARVGIGQPGGNPGMPDLHYGYIDRNGEWVWEPEKF